MIDILLTNDDGYSSIGFYPLLKSLSKEFSIMVVAPDTHKSWVGKSLTSRDGLHLNKEQLEEFKINTLSGTPADCVQVGLYNVLKTKPKLVMSGINIGPNTGHGRILSSGTIGAAMEASIEGIKSIASSLYIPEHIEKTLDCFDPKNYYLLDDAAEITLKITKLFMENKPDKNIDVLSINIPYGATVNSEIVITYPHREPYGQLFHKQNNVISHRSPALDFTHMPEGSDLKAISEGKISITPLNLDLVSKEAMENLNNLIKRNW